MEPGAIIALAILVITFAGAVAAGVWKVCSAIASIKSDLSHQITCSGAELHRRIDSLVVEQSHLNSRVTAVESVCRERHAG